jgi:hypothetical protein
MGKIRIRDKHLASGTYPLVLCTASHFNPVFLFVFYKYDLDPGKVFSGSRIPDPKPIFLRA